MIQENDAQRLLLLHRRLLDGDRVVSEEIMESLLLRLVGELQRKFPTTDAHLISDGVTDALLDYCQKPAAFDIDQRVPLDRFLTKASWRNIANLLRGERRRKLREVKSAKSSIEKVVELDPEAGNSFQDETQDEQAQLGKLTELLDDPTDKRVFQLRAMGERRTEQFARVMGIIHLPIDEQRREVKRAKDRIDKQLRRGKEPKK